MKTPLGYSEYHLLLFYRYYYYYRSYQVVPGTTVGTAGTR